MVAKFYTPFLGFTDKLFSLWSVPRDLVPHNGRKNIYSEPVYDVPAHMPFMVVGIDLMPKLGADGLFIKPRIQDVCCLRNLLNALPIKAAE